MSSMSSERMAPGSLLPITKDGSKVETSSQSRGFSSDSSLSLAHHSSPQNTSGNIKDVSKASIAPGSMETSLIPPLTQGIGARNELGNDKRFASQLKEDTDTSEPGETLEPEVEDKIVALHKEMTKQGLPHTIAFDPDPDNSSVISGAISISADSYVDDLMAQKATRLEERKQEAMEEALEFYNLRIQGGEPESEDLYLSIFNSVMKEKEEGAKEKDQKQDDRLKKELLERDGERTDENSQKGEVRIQDNEAETSESAVDVTEEDQNTNKFNENVGSTGFLERDKKGAFTRKDQAISNEPKFDKIGDPDETSLEEESRPEIRRLGKPPKGKRNKTRGPITKKKSKGGVKQMQEHLMEHRSPRKNRIRKEDTSLTIPNNRGIPTTVAAAQKGGLLDLEAAENEAAFQASKIEAENAARAGFVMRSKMVIATMACLFSIGVMVVILLDPVGRFKSES